MEKKIPRCEICREQLTSKNPRQSLLFVREDRVVEKFKVCPACYNKYVLQIRQDIMPEDHTPEKTYPLHPRSSGYFLQEKSGKK